MAPKINFDEIANKNAEGGIVVSGASRAFEGAKLIHRHVALHQDGKVADGPASKVAQWKTTPALADRDFTDGVVAVGTELYLVTDDTEDGAVPTFVTMTWSEVLEVRSVP